MRTIAVSGGFDPVHIGHIKMFEQAKRMGDYLVVIMNGDQWLKRKKGYVFMPQEERAAVLRALKAVDQVIIYDSPDRDDVCEPLMRLRPQVFCNGGDRKDDNVPEVAMCNTLGIELAFNVGGGKEQSSSALVSRATSRADVRPWGQFFGWDRGKGWYLKSIYIRAGGMLSLQSHSKRAEHWMLVEGDASVATEAMGGMPLTPFKSVKVEVGAKHRLFSKEGGVIVEIAEGDFDENDIVRYDDKYGRK